MFRHFARWCTLSRILLFVIAGIIFSACNASPTIVEERTVDGLTIALERPAQPVALRDYSFTATITDAADHPVEATLVYFDFTMPQMEMGVHQPIADRIGPGKYEVRTIYSMEGDWRITVVATINGREVRAWFDHSVLPP
ncbi:MAG: FixH family protein [Roseiflexus sp.]|nr:FixH family protein [Roseiflexus sp.]MCS7290862.1 FixH family protein [Roseiflexus sp.]MDW8146311.1 FixH family protein [Roseiflexaceae bacterium]MDW8234609.1 FixH family protein [Roseiflexaceae bacterium]